MLNWFCWKSVLNTLEPMISRSQTYMIKSCALFRAGLKSNPADTIQTHPKPDLFWVGLYCVLWERLYARTLCLALVLLLIRLLAVMCLPGAACDLHVREHSSEARILRAAGVNTEADLSAAFQHMAYTHL